MCIGEEPVDLVVSVEGLASSFGERGEEYVPTLMVGFLRRNSIFLEQSRVVAGGWCL